MIFTLGPEDRDQDQDVEAAGKLKDRRSIFRRETRRDLTDFVALLSTAVTKSFEIEQNIRHPNGAAVGVQSKMSESSPVAQVYIVYVAS